MAVKPIPEGFHTITPFLVVSGAASLMTFIKNAFDGEVIENLQSPDGVVMHAEVKVGDSIVMISDVRGGCDPVKTSLYMYVPDVDAAYKSAIAAGATSVSEPADHFYGDRACGVDDPCGNRWWIATRIENLSQEEIQARAAQHAQS